MSNEVKVKVVKELSEKFMRCKGAAIADYRGLTALEMVDLRKKLRSESVELCVVKNTLARIAAVGTPMEKVAETFNGPTSIALSYSDLTAPARVMVGYEKLVSKLKVRGGLIDGKPLTLDEVKLVAELPSKDVLLSRLLAAMNAPVTNFAGVLASVIRKLLYAFKEIEKKKG